MKAELLTRIDELLVETRHQTMAAKVDRLLESCCPAFTASDHHEALCDRAFEWAPGDWGWECEPPPKTTLALTQLWTGSTNDLAAAEYMRSVVGSCLEGGHVMITMSFGERAGCLFCYLQPEISQEYRAHQLPEWRRHPDDEVSELDDEEPF